MIKPKFEYTVNCVKNGPIGRVVLLNPVGVGEVIKKGSESYRVLDIWHGETGSSAFVKVIDQATE